jgi:hypothetical protein
MRPESLTSYERAYVLAASPAAYGGPPPGTLVDAGMVTKAAPTRYRDHTTGKVEHSWSGGLLTEKGRALKMAILEADNATMREALAIYKHDFDGDLGDVARERLDALGINTAMGEP